MRNFEKEELKMELLILVLFVVVLVLLASCIKIVPQAYAYVVERPA